MPMKCLRIGNSVKFTIDMGRKGLSSIMGVVEEVEVQMTCLKAFLVVALVLNLTKGSLKHQRVMM